MIDSGIGFVQPMFFVGVVEDRDDPRAEGRVKVRAFGVHGSNRDIPTTELPWATLIIGNHDVNFTPPPLNAWVFGFFIDGRDAQQPMILGLIPSQGYDLVDPETRGWGTVPAENYDLQSQGTRPRDLGLGPMSKLATGEFLNETYNEALEVNRVRDIPIAGGCVRNHYPMGNGNGWGNDLAEGSVSGPPRQIAAPEQARIDALDNDTEFQSELKRMMAKHGVTREQVYGIIAGESSYNPSIINSFGYAGFFQFGNTALADVNTRNGTNFTPQIIAGMSPAQQLSVYDKYLDRWGFRNSSGLGIMQAAPSFAGRPGNTEVYPRGSEAWQKNPVWRGPDGRITVDSINSYYNRKNPPSLEGPPENNTTNPNESKLSSADEIRARIAEIDKQLETEKNSDKIKQLVAERKSLEAELTRVDTSNPIDGTTDSPYSGYSVASADPSCTSTWDEPPSGYSAKYPFNRVIETASGHSIELDDTPGGERIMIWHRDGSYIQITGSSTSSKNMGDKYEINERNNHVYIGGNNIITIEGDSHVLIKGNKVEEIVGDYKQIVHGNIMVGGAGRVEINGADRTDIRSASLGLDSNVENLNIRTGKNIVFESGESISLKSKNIRIGASENMSVSGEKSLFLQAISGDVHLKSKGNTFMNPEQNLYLRTESGSVGIQSEGPIKLNSSGSFISINSNSYLSVGAKAELLIASDSGSVNISSAENMGLSAKMMFVKGDNDVNIMASGGKTNIGAGSDISFKAASIKVNASGNVSIRGSTVYLDDIIQLASGSGGVGSLAANDVETKAQVLPTNFDNADSGNTSSQALPAEPPASAQSAAISPSTPPDRHPPAATKIALA
jgi:uncharacterized protein (DUF2345 family)